MATGTPVTNVRWPDLIHSQFAPDLGTAGEVGAAWKMAALAKAGF